MITPSKRWHTLPLSSSSRPVLLPYETELFVQDNVGLYDGKSKVLNFQNGRVYLTNKRICYVDNVNPLTNSVYLNLEEIDHVDLESNLLLYRSSPKIVLYFRDNDKPDLARNSRLKADLSELSDNSSSDKLSTTDSNRSPEATPMALSVSDLLSQNHSITITWVCPICFFSNKLPFNFVLGSTPLPACQMCGVPADLVTIEKAINELSSNKSRDTNATPNINPGSTKKGTTGVECSRCTFINHPAMNCCEMCGAVLEKGRATAQETVKQQRPDVKSKSSKDLTANSRVDSSASGVSHKDVVKLSFRAGDSGETKFYAILKGSLKDKSWLNVGHDVSGNKSSTEEQDSNFGSITNSNGRSIINSDSRLTLTGNRTVINDTGGPSPPKRSIGMGIHGLEQSNSKQVEENQQVIGTALGDLKSLMAQAQKLVQLSASFEEILQKQQKSDPYIEKQRELLRRSKYMLNGGRSTSRQMFKDPEMYFCELARQVSEFLSCDELLEKHEGGVMTLVDLYAMFNRSRVYDLISPEELLNAVSRFEELRLPFRLKKFPNSGVMVVVAARYGIDDDAFIARVMNSIRRSPGISLFELSTDLGTSVGVISEEINLAVAVGKVAIDEQISGVRYYENIIDGFECDWIYYGKFGRGPPSNTVTAESIPQTKNGGDEIVWDNMEQIRDLSLKTESASLDDFSSQSGSKNDTNSTPSSMPMTPTGYILDFNTQPLQPMPRQS